MPGRATDFFGTVVRREHLTPSLTRLVLGGPGLKGWGDDMPDATDAYLVLWFPPADAPYAAPFCVEEVQKEHPRARWPVHRHYSVRTWDPAARELTVDVVVHGDSGIAGRWARRAEVGDVVVVSPPRGAYRPDTEADWHLMAGDESAFPAIAASLEVLPHGSRAVVVLVCDGPEHEIDLTTDAALEAQWLHRSGDPSDADLLVDAVRARELPGGRVHAFVHGEAGEVREVRRHLLGERGIPRADLSVSGYWRRTMTDEAWRRIKREWNAEVETDVPSA